MPTIALICHTYDTSLREVLEDHPEKTHEKGTATVWITPATQIHGRIAKKEGKQSMLPSHRVASETAA